MFQHEGTGLVRIFMGSRAVSDDANAKAKIKLNIPEMDHESVAGILLCDPDATLAFFNPDDNMKPVYPGIRAIKSANCWEEMHKIKLGNLKKQTVKQLRVVEVIPKEGGVFDVTIWLLIERPTDNYLEVLAERCNREMAVSIEQFVEDPPEQEDIKQAIAKEKKKAKTVDDEQQALPLKPEKKKRDHKAERPARKAKKQLDAVAETMAGSEAVN